MLLLLLLLLVVGSLAAVSSSSSVLVADDDGNPLDKEAPLVRQLLDEDELASIAMQAGMATAVGWCLGCLGGRPGPL